MDHDDRTIGHILSRRGILAIFGTAWYAWLAGASPLPAQGRPASEVGCVVRPEQTEGPYFVDEMLNRVNLRSDPSDGSVRPGIPLALTLVVSRLAGNACAPPRNIQVDLWQCDHEGIYSDVQDPNVNATGWYPGRTVHIHFRLRSRSAAGPYAGRGARTTRNDGDRIFRENGSQLRIAPTPSNGGYAGTFHIALQRV